MQSVTFLSHEDIKPTFFTGYKRQMDIGIAFGKLATELEKEYRFLLFGSPGTGKTVYPQALAYNLNKEDLNYSLITVKCNSLRIDSPKYVRRLIKKIKSYFEDDRIILVLDELDIFAQRRDEGEYNFYNTATGYVMNLLDERTSSTIILGITNNPYKLDIGVRDRFDYPIYFPISDSDIEHILKHGGIPNPKETADQLYAISKDGQTKISGRRIFKSMNFVSIIGESNNVLSKMKLSNDPKEMAIRLYLNSGIPISDEEVEDYEEENRAIIGKSEMLLSCLFGNNIP